MRRSLYVPVVGGLGNQMFIVATGLAAAKKHSMECIVPRFEESDSCFEPRPVYWDSVFQNVRTTPLTDEALVSGLPHATVLAEDSDPSGVLSIPPTSASNDAGFVLRGFFQSPHYFEAYRHEICGTLMPRDLIAKARAYAHDLLLHSSGEVDIRSTSMSAQNPLGTAFTFPSVDTFASIGNGARHCLGIHIRRGDYLKLPDMFDVLPVEYYLHGIQQLYGGMIASTAARYDLNVLIFSEDKEYGRLLAGTIRTRYRLPGGNVVVAQSPHDYLELYAMSLCDDLIIANSSFSWWAAYLQQTPNSRVIAPSKWFKERGFTPSLYPSRWMIL